MFKQNYLNELPDDIQDKIWTMVNKNKFNDCLTKIDNPKIRKFYNFYNMLNDKFFEISYDICNGELGWFHKATDAEIDEDRNYAYEMYQRDRCLSWKAYTEPDPEYENIKYYNFSYSNGRTFTKKELVIINRLMKRYIIDTELMITNKIIFTKHTIQIWFRPATMYKENTATDVSYNLTWGYNLIPEMYKYLELTTNVSFDYAVDYHANHHFLEGYDIVNKVVEPFFGS
jgi:hypothetical protein